MIFLQRLALRRRLDARDKVIDRMVGMIGRCILVFGPASQHLSQIHYISPQERENLQPELESRPIDLGKQIQTFLYLHLRLIPRIQLLGLQK